MFTKIISIDSLLKFQKIQKFSNGTSLEEFYRKFQKYPKWFPHQTQKKSVGNYKTNFGLIKFLRGYNLKWRHGFNSVVKFVEDNIPQFESERIQPRVKTHLQFGSLVCGRQYSTVRKWEDTTSCPLDSSVDCSETNVTVIPRITCECSTIVEAVCSIVFITIVIESG